MGPHRTKNRAASSENSSLKINALVPISILFSTRWYYFSTGHRYQYYFFEVSFSACDVVTVGEGEERNDEELRNRCQKV